MKPPGKEHGNPLSRPVQEVKSTLHGEVSKVEGDNSGVQAGHLGERQIEKAVGYGSRRFHQARADRKLKPWRDVSKAEQAAVKANADFYWRKSVMENPQLASSNPISRPVAEETPAKAVRRRPPGRNGRGPGSGQGVPDRRLRSEEGAAGPSPRSWAASSPKQSSAASSL